MLTLIFNTKMYNFLKSGFLLDFFFKKIIYKFIRFTFFVFSIVFSEKFFIEQSFLKINNFLFFFKSKVNLIGLKTSYKFVGFFLLTSYFILFFIFIS